MPWGGRAAELSAKLQEVVGNSFGKKAGDSVGEICASLRRLTRLGRAALQPFQSAEDAEFLCEVASYDLVQVLPGGPKAQPKSAALARELQGVVRSKAESLYESTAQELCQYLVTLLTGKGGRDAVGSGHKYSNRVEKLALLLGKEPPCEDAKRLVSVSARASDIVTKGATGALSAQDVALLTTAAEDMSKVNKGGVHAAIQWFENRGGEASFTIQQLEALMGKAQQAAASFQKAKREEQGKALNELPAVKEAKAFLAQTEAFCRWSLKWFRADSTPIPTSLRLRFESDSTPMRFRFDSDSDLASNPTGAPQAGGRGHVRAGDEGDEGRLMEGRWGARFWGPRF